MVSAGIAGAAVPAVLRRHLARNRGEGHSQSRDCSDHWRFGDGARVVYRKRHLRLSCSESSDEHIVDGKAPHDKGGGYVV